MRSGGFSRRLKLGLKASLRYAAARAPWGVREALLDGCLSRLRFGEVYERLLPRCQLAEIAANGDRGVVASSAHDTMVIAEYARTGTFAPEVTQALQEFFRASGGTYIDAGANIGLMTIPFARDPRIRCIAFEPEPENFRLLRQNIARDAPDATIEFHQNAIYHSESVLRLALAQGNIGDHRLAMGGDPALWYARRRVEHATREITGRSGNR